MKHNKAFFWFFNNNYVLRGIKEKNFGVLLWGKFPKNELQTMGRKRITPKVVSTIQPSIKYWKLLVLSCLNTLIHNLAIIFFDQTQMHLTMPNLEEFIPTWQIIYPDTLVLYVQVMHMSVNCNLSLTAGPWTWLYNLRSIIKNFTYFGKVLNMEIIWRCSHFYCSYSYVSLIQILRFQRGFYLLNDLFRTLKFPDHFLDQVHSCFWC